MSKNDLYDIIEIHPWDRFPFTNNAKYLIIGSFPPNKFTGSSKKKNKGDMEFFYGSKENAFWKLFHGNENEIVSHCKNDFHL